jgi:hypothetical protein
MRRRRLLVVLGAVLGGTTYWTVGAREAGADSLSFEVSIVNERPTRAKPPVVRISVQNVDNEMHTIRIPNKGFPFATPLPDGAGAGRTIVLDERIPSNRNGDCWTGRGITLPASSEATLFPGEKRSDEYAVMTLTTDDETAACWPPGSYTFTEHYGLDPEESDSPGIEWGFTLAVDQDGSIEVDERDAEKIE